MATLSQAPKSHTLAEFKRLLATEWTRRVACQDPSHGAQGYCPGHQFVHVAALEAWWKQPADEATWQRNIDCLFDEMQFGEHPQLPLDPQPYANTCLRVLSLLLQHDLGYLIERFYNSNTNDKSLGRSEGFSDLRFRLQEKLPARQVDHAIEVFHSARWEYCPLELRLHMNQNLRGSDVIIPFCRKIRLGEGSSASVHRVLVQKDLIWDDNLRSALEQSLILDPEFGECYQMALKSCRNFERNAFFGLHLNLEVPIIHCLGCYAHDRRESSSSSADPRLEKTYNLLLEYGERNLYQHWTDTTNMPPVQAEEIVSFWESLFKVARAIRHVHHLETSMEKGPSQKFRRWHADIKPTNILIVYGQFKLASFGYSEFFPFTKGVPREFVDGSTDTYSAPEVSRANRSDGSTSEVTQSIDTWSFGCVLSVAATWVVLGFQGIRQYEELRKQSTTNAKDGKSIDRFHDDVGVLPEVYKWHKYLKAHLRVSDIITSHVLDFVESKMLQTEGQDRLGITTLCQELDRLVRTARKELKGLDEPTKNTASAVLLQNLTKIEEDAYGQDSSEISSDSDSPGYVLTDVVSAGSGASSNSMLVGEVTSDVVEVFAQSILQNELLRKLCSTALKQSWMRQATFKHKLEISLKAFVSEVAQESHNEAQDPLARFVRDRSSSITSKMISIVKSDAAGLGLKLTSLKNLGQADPRTRVSEFGQRATITKVSKALASMEEDSDTADDDYDEKALNVRVESVLEALRQVENIWYSSNAFANLERRLHAFVYPSFRYILMKWIQKQRRACIIPSERLPELERLVSEIQHIAPDQISAHKTHIISVLDYVKGLLEDATGETWDWWPLKPRARPVPDGEVRLYWTCTCGKDRWADIPLSFASKIRDAMQKAAGQDAHRAAAGIAPRDFDVRGVIGSPPVTQTQVPLRPSAPEDGPVQTSSSTPPGNSLHHQSPPKAESHVFFVTEAFSAHGDYRRLSQTCVEYKHDRFYSAMSDRDFFSWLRKQYLLHQGYLARCFGLHNYSHSEFYQFERYAGDRYALRGSDYPPDAEKSYTFRPRPIAQNPPISPEEFNHWFEEHSWRRILWQAVIPKRRWSWQAKLGQKATAIHLIPKRRIPIDEEDDRREVFWGLYAVQIRSALMAFIYSIISLLPSIIFFFA